MTTAQKRRRISSDSDDSDFLPKTPLPIDYSSKAPILNGSPLDKFGNVLLSSVIGLNRSFGKIVLTGLHLDKFRLFSPVVFLGSNSFTGVSLSNEVWKNLVKEFPAFTQFFANAPRKAPTHRFHCDGFSYRFITSLYGQRTIAIYPRSMGAGQSTNSGGTAFTLQSTAYEPALYIHEVTFKKLTAVAHLIDLRLKNLHASVSVARECMTHIVEVLKNHVPSITALMGKDAELLPSGRFILETIMKKKNDHGESIMCDIVRPKIQFDNFVCDVDLIINEITQLYHDAIIDEAIGQ